MATMATIGHWPYQVQDYAARLIEGGMSEEQAINTAWQKHSQGVPSRTGPVSTGPVSPVQNRYREIREGSEAFRRSGLGLDYGVSPLDFGSEPSYPRTSPEEIAGLFPTGGAPRGAAPSGPGLELTTGQSPAVTGATTSPKAGGLGLRYSNMMQNPLVAIGLALQNTAAGYEGKPSVYGPIMEGMQREQEQQQVMDLNKQKMGLQLLEVVPTALLKWRQSGGSPGTLQPLVDSINKHSRDLYGKDMIPPEMVKGLESGDKVLMGMLDGMGAGVYTPQDVARLASTYYTDKEGTMKMAEVLRNGRIGELIAQEQTKNPGKPLMDGLRAVATANPKLTPFLKDFGYKPEPELGAMDKIQEDNRKEGATLLKLFRGGKITLEQYFTGSADLKGFEAETGLSPTERAEFRTLGERIGGAKALTTQVTPGGQTVGQIEIRQSREREFQRQMAQAEVANTPQGKREFFNRAFQGRYGGLEAELQTDKTGTPLITKVQTARTKGQAILAGATTDLSNLKTDIDKLDQIKEQWTKNPKTQEYLDWTVAAAEILGVDNALLKAKEYFAKDKNFTQFWIDNQRMMLTAFTLGGKQLTAFEAAVTFGITPTGRESNYRLWSAKVDHLIEWRKDQFRNLSSFATKTRQELEAMGTGVKSESSADDRAKAKFLQGK